jgi:hypothetical protein
MAQKIFKEGFINSLARQLRKGDRNAVNLVKKVPLKFTDSDIVVVDEYPDLSGLNLSGNDQGKDFQFKNAILLYEALPITPYQASDPSLWSYLALVTFRSYMTALRSEIPDEDEAAGRYLASHYFCAGSSVKDLLLNDISLLWWAAHLTVQKDCREPYRLTKEVFTMLDYTRHLLPGTQGRSPAFRHAVLEFVVENSELFKTKREGKVRLIMRRLNMFAGYQLFPLFSKDEVKSHIETLREEIVHYQDDEQ